RDARVRRHRASGGTAGCGASLRDAEARRARARARLEAATPPPRRAGGRPQPRGGRGAGDVPPPPARRAEAHRAARRASHEPRHARVRPRARAQLRPHDRERRARGGAARSEGDRGLPRRRAGGCSVTALLELEDVHARYGPVLALLGANGAGKTTTLRAISGTVRRDGTIRFAGRALDGGADGAARRGIAHVPEGRGTFAEMTVWENLRLGAYTRRGALKDDFARVRSYFPWLEDRRGQQAGTLSGGEQQMLALARAFMQRPRLVLLDEPSLGLAPLLVTEIFRIVKELNEREGMTALVVEQNAHIALQAASSAYVLEVGRVALSGPSEELQAHESVRRSYLGY